MGGFAWVTLATNDSYSLGALVLAHSLRNVGTKHDLAVLVTPGVTGAMREKLSSVFSLVQEVNVLDSKDEANLALLARPELGITFTKLHCWRLTQYEKCVFIDADALVIRNCDELFEREELSAAPDVGWPDCFNSGVFVFKPSQETFASLTSFAAAKGSFDGGDQGLLNQYFSDWAHKDISKHLPFIYNMCSTATYSYLPAFKQFGEDVRIIHFIGITKPWLQYFDTLSGQVQPAPGSHHLQPLLQLWWNIFCDNVHPELSPGMASSTLARHWHEFRPYPSFSNDPTTLFHDFSDIDDSLYDNDEPDFTEFNDPWDNYSERTIFLFDDSVNIDKDDPRNDNHDNNNEKYMKKNYFEPSNAFEPKYKEHSSDLNFFNRDHEIPSVSQNNDNYETRDDNCEFKSWEIHRSRSDLQNIHDDSRNSRVDNTRTPNWESGSICNVQYNQNDESINFSKIHEHGDNSSEINRRQNPATFHHEKEKQGDYRDPLHYCRGNDSKRRSDNEISFRDEAPIESDSRLTNRENRLEDRDTSDSPKERTDLSISHPLPHTESKNVTTRSETNITRQLESNDAGIAGALAKLTLGEARSAEQVAFEEHMRKQSWEQGQIDYMGRDSFDNIWKKITATLGTQPEREPSPPKIQPKPEKTEIKEPTALPTVDQPTAKSEAAVPTEPQQKDEQDVIGELAHEVKKLVAPLSASTPEESTESSTTSCLPSLSDAAIEKPAEFSTLESLKAAAEDFSEPKTTDSTMTPSCEIRERKEEREEILDCQKRLEVGAESQVPIQVAESVLEADVKESVTEDLRPVTEEAISSISSIAQESVPAVLETAMEASDPIEPTSNRSATLFSGIGNGIDALSLSASTEMRKPLVIVPPERTEVPELPTFTEEPTTKVEASSSMVAELVEEPKIITETECLPVEAPKKADSAISPEIQSTSTLLEAAEKSATLPETPRVLPTPIVSTNIPGGSEKSKVSLTDPKLSTQVTIDQSPVEKTQDPLVESAGHDVSPTLATEVAPAAEISKTAPSSVSPPKEPEVIPPVIESCNLPASATVEKVDSPSPPAVETKVPISCPAKPARKADEPTKKMKKPTIPIDSEIKETEETSRAESRERSPVRPVRTKELEIPATPTITEPTPPTSPPAGGAESLQEPTAKVTKKIVKKVTKKTSETKLAEGAEPDTDGKKATKKIVKKVVKKKEEDGNGSESTSGTDKPKKIVKVVKKTTKAPQTLDAEATVPETPPPGTSEVPVPPKRKLKTTTKSTTGKSDAEP